MKRPLLHGYGDTMKNITISVDNDLYEEARDEAARRRKSLSALVREFLAGLHSRGGKQTDPELQQLYEMVDRKHARRKGSAGPLNREEMHERGISGH